MSQSINPAKPMKKLIIAEKPSVASDIAKALGGFVKHADFYENDEYVISSAVGHLLEIKAPDNVEVKRGKWSFAHLPVLPTYFELAPIAKSESRLKVLTKLLKRKDIGGVINACDAGREGELIFRYIIQYAAVKKPIERLWLQSMTPQAIREGFSRLRSDEDMQALADAARSRSEADWLVGINGTRAMTAFNSRDGGFFLTTVGRVQTPTLSIVVEREEKIRRFISKPYWKIEADFICAAGVYKGTWFNPQFVKNDDPEYKDNRLWSEAEAKAIVAACKNKLGTVSEETKPQSQAAPLLFDLTSLQREANARFGFSAKNTLALAQALYEKHKALTYPRTDSRALPEDYLSVAKTTLENLTEQDDYALSARNVLKNQWIKPNKRIFDNKKINDHFAIIPTTTTPKGLSEAEQKIYDLVTRRFIAIFYPSAEYLVSTRITTVTGYHFKTEGRILVSPGWLAVYGKERSVDDDQLPIVAPDENVITDQLLIQELTTKPPARYTEATLLSAMEGAGKWVDDEELRSALSAKGLGTPATRATIIEGLLTEKYLLREGRELVPTAKAFQLMTLLRGLGVVELTKPELTGEWEFKLSQIERKELTRESFMRDIAQMTQQIVKHAKEYSADTIPGDYATLRTPCPHCGHAIKENYRRFSCSHCSFSLTKTPAGRSFELDEVETLLTDKIIGPLQGFRSKMGRPFAAVLKIVPDQENGFKMEFDFGQSEQHDDETIDLSAHELIGTCPKCQNGVYALPMKFACEHSLSNPKQCEFSVSRVILQQTIESEQMVKLLTHHKTDLLTQFKSSKTGRFFKAHLILDEKGKIGFEFEARTPKSATKKSANSATVVPDKPAKQSAVSTAKQTKRSTKKTTSQKADDSSATENDRSGSEQPQPIAKARKQPVKSRKSSTTPNP